LSIDSPFTPHYLETEFDHERIGVTIWDSQGLEKKFVDLQLREMSSFLESKFEETFTEEQKVVRAPGVRDTHIHCVFLILDPSRLDANLAFSQKQAKTPSARFDEPLRLMGILDEDLDVQVLRTLQGKTTVIPVISKADTITTNHMGQLKRAVWDSLKQAKLDPLEALAFGEDEDDESDDRLDERDEDALLHEDDVDDNDDSGLVDELVDRSDDAPGQRQGELNNQLRQNHRRTPSGLGNRLSQAEMTADGKSDSPYLPMSIISPDTYEPGVVGRRFPWGFADPYNPDHCDFVRLKDSVFSEWRGELREASREIWYEGWRTSRLNRRGGTAQGAKTATSANGRFREVSGSKAAVQASSPYGGGPVGHASNSAAYMSPTQQQMLGQARPTVPGPGQGTSEMVRGVYRQGVNAF
jgi:septin family protein